MAVKIDQRTKFVLTTLLFSLGGFINAQLKLGWQFSSLLTVAACAVFAGYIIRHRDPILGRLAIFGLAAGSIELFADCWGERIGGLVYFPGGPTIMCSPLYMPFGWAILMIQIGYIGWWLAGGWGIARATIFTTILGSINIPSYEYWAKQAGLWYYDSPPMLFNTVPYYVIVAEALICMALPFTVTWLEKKQWRWSILAGVSEGFWMWGAGLVAFYFFRT
jgi:hypothetical protein